MAIDTDIITSSLHLLFIFIFMGVNVFVNESVYMCMYRIMSFVLMTFSDITDYHDEVREGNFLKCYFFRNPITSCV